MKPREKPREIGVGVDVRFRYWGPLPFGRMLKALLQRIRRLFD